MADEIRQFAARLMAGSLTDDNIIDEKLKRFENMEDRRLCALLNHQFFASQNRLTAYLLQALQEEPRQSEPIRKRLYQFIANHVRTQFLSLIDHVKSLFAQLVSLFWKEEGRIKEYSIEPLIAIVQVYEEDFLTANDVLNPQRLHEDVKNMLQTHTKMAHGVVGECWYLLAVIQSKFPHVIGPVKKKSVQEVLFMELKKYVSTDKNLNTIATLLRALARALRENYFGDVMIEELFSYVMVLVPPLKATYAVHLAALELLSERRELFHGHIMMQARKLFAILREGVNHKNKEYKLKCLEVLIEVCEELVKGISGNKEKGKSIFAYIKNQVLEDLQLYVAKDKASSLPPEDKKGLNLLTVVRLLGIISPLYVEFQGRKHYKDMFDYIIKKCTKKIIRDNNLSLAPTAKTYELKYVLYAQKELNAFILSLSKLVEHLQDIEYSAAGQLEEIFISAVKESKYFLPKYEADLWEAMIQLIMSMHSKGAIFAKWAKKVVSESLKECLDSQKMGVENDDEFIRMIEKAAHLWKSLLTHSSWRTGPLNEFTEHLLSNLEYLLLNLNCGYRVRAEEDHEQADSQEEGIVQIFYLANERIEIIKVEDYQYLSSLSLLLHEILSSIDPSLYNQKLVNFYPQILERIRAYPKCLPLLRTLRSLNEYILKNQLLKEYQREQPEYARELIQKMSKFFKQTAEVVFKFQEQYFYELLKVLLSFSEEVYLSDGHRIAKHHLPILLVKTFQLGQEVVSLAHAALRCTSRLFTSERQASERYLQPVIASLEKYINLAANSEREEFKSQLFLFELKVTRESISDSVLSFLGSLGGLCHQLVDSKNKDHISWDYDCRLQVEVNILNEKLGLNLTRFLNRVCWLSINGKDDIKIVACELLHAEVTYVIEEVVSNKMEKENLATFLDRVLPVVLTVAANTSHPSQQLLHTLLIQVIHFFANTKQPNSPDVQVILKHLLSLYNKSEDLGYIASKCLSEFIRWHIKQQPEKNGDVPVLKALMGNIWSLVGNKNAREGIIHFLIKLLKIIYRETEIMRYYSIELGSLLISLARYHHSLEAEFKYLLEKYTACIKKYIKYLIIPEDNRLYKKTPTIHAYLEELYKSGFFSIYQQQRQASFLIWLRILKDSPDVLGYTEVKFLKDRAQKEKKYLFGGSRSIDFAQVEEGDFAKCCWRLIGLGEIWLRMLEEKIFLEANLVQFLDLECVYLVSFVSLLAYLQAAQETGSNCWDQEVQEAIVANFKTFLTLFSGFSIPNACLIYAKFSFSLDQNNVPQKLFHSYLFNIVFRPDAFIKNMSRDLMSGQELKTYLHNFINYFQIAQQEEGERRGAIERVFLCLNAQMRFGIDKIVDYLCMDETASERTILSVMELLKTAYAYQQTRGRTEENNYLKTLISKLLNQFQSAKPEREYNIVLFLLGFNYSITHKFACFEVQTNSPLFQRYEQHFVQFLVNNWQQVEKAIVKISLSSINNAKLLYVLLLKLNQHQKQGLIAGLASEPASPPLIRDLLKLNFLLLKQLQEVSSHYVAYLERVVAEGLSVEQSLEVHQETLYLCGLMIQKRLRADDTMRTLKATLNTLGNKYCPFCISKLDNPEKQEAALKYFSIVRNFIVLSEDFAFIDQFFVMLKDLDNIGETRREVILNYIEDCVRTCFSLENNRPLEWAQMLLKYYWDEELDKDEWANYRLLILEKIFRKTVSYMSLEHLQRLYDEHIVALDRVLKRPLATDSLKALLLDMQVKNGAFLLVELLYGNLPRREKKEGARPENQNHKLFIKYATEVAKRLLDQGAMRMLRDHDAREGETRRAMRAYKEYNCYAYNCLIVLFISTQSNKEHFKTFIFEHNKQALWDNLVDTAQTEFGFEIETNFKVMQPYAPLRNKINQIRTKIEKTYFESSLYVVQEENIPLGKLEEIEEEEDEEKEAVPIKNAHNIMLNSLIEEDIINRHPCMMNLLRVVDFLTTTFPETNPSWMRPIEAYLATPSITLPETILILKLILNRPNIFHQADVWAKPILNYLAEPNTGSKFIHYFYRDALKRFLKFLPDLISFRPETAKVNAVVMRLVKNLPHENVRVFSDNIDMLEELLRVPGVYIDRKTITSMLKNDGKDKNDWRMCAVITLKLALTARVPVLAEQDYPRLRDSPARFEYYYTHVKAVLSLVFELAAESSKQYRIAAAGFLGELLAFIFASELEEGQKKEYFKAVSSFLISLLEKAANRSTKEKFTLALEKISARFPQVLAEEKLFAIVEGGLFQFTGSERQQLLVAFREFVRSLLAFSETSKISNFFMLLRVNCEKLVADTADVQLALLQLLTLATDHRLLADRDILYSYHLTIDRLHPLAAQAEPIASEYYLLLVSLKKYLVDPETRKFDFSPALLAKVEEKLVEGLSSKFESTRKMVFAEFEQEAAAIPETENIHRYLQIFRRLYQPRSEGEWLVSVVPIILTLCRVSSDYNRLFSQARLEDSMTYYDWDFRNFKINDASLPYTPFTSNPRREGPKPPASQGASLRGLIRATQNSPLSQQEQIFTMLESLSSQEPSQISAPQEGGEEAAGEQYSRINDLFRNRRRRNELMDSFKENNISNSSPAVQYVEDKIRFAKHHKVEAGFKRFRSRPTGERARKGALLRAYKLGELPNIEISPQHLVEPLIFLAGRDHELASEILLQVVGRLCTFSIKNCELVKEALSGYLLGSTQLNFNFVSTLQKCLIRICQQHGKFLDVSLREVAVGSNTLHYAVLFTEENIIQLTNQGEGTDLETIRARRGRLERQWFDLADYYQLLNQIDMIESVMVKVTEGAQRDTLTEALRKKKDGDLNDAQRIITSLLATSPSARLAHFLEKEKVDCSVLLSEWQEVSAQGTQRLERGESLQAEEVRMLVIAAENLEAGKRGPLIGLLELQEQPDYERALVSVMREQQLDRARYHALNAKEVFRREWERVSSFAFNSKHELLQTLQKNHQLLQFLDLYKRPEARESDCRQLFQLWSRRKPDQIFDDNTTWVQILSSRTLLGGLLGQRWGVSAEAMAKSNTEWLVQVVKGMIERGVLGYAENVVRKALYQHRLSKEFNWNFYEAISQLKLMQIVRKGSLRIQEYEIVPKLIQKEMNTYGDSSSLSRFKLALIRNQYLQGFMEVCLAHRAQLDLPVFVQQAANVLRNYRQVGSGLKQLQGEADVGQGFRKETHFQYALFLENLLSVVKGKFEIKDAATLLGRLGHSASALAESFIEQLVYSIRLADLGRSYEEGQQLFSMLLKLIKLVQGDHKQVGARFEEALADNRIPKWMFIYFIPQIIRNLNNADLATRFRDLFDFLLAKHPEALVYPFNCAYPRRKDCLTPLTLSLFDDLRTRVGRYFEFIENLVLLQHPEMRLKDILNRFLNHGEAESALNELVDFTKKNELLGKYNQSFHQKYATKINQVLQLRRRGQAKEAENQMRAIVAALDPNKSTTMKYFTKLSDGSHWFEDYNCSDWTRLEVPGSSYTQFEEPQPWKKVFIQSFDAAILTLTSIRRPKRITLLGSDEKLYMLLVKGGEDVRLDQRVEHLFEVVNRIMAHHTDTNRKQLEVARFEVVPMKPMFGVFEWVDKSKTLRAFYEAELKLLKGKPEASLSSDNEGYAEFYAYFKKLCPNSDDRHVWHKTLMTRPEEEVVKNMNRCESKIPYGLLRFGLEKLAKNYDSFLHLKNKFITNYSAICLVTYIFGIGDRHLENFLIQTSTGNLVMIDFGYSFCASIELPIPELIPFRLTKSIRDLAAPIGLDGSFKKSMVACFEALHKKLHLIVDYCDVFVDDPLMEWVWVSRRQLNQANPNASIHLHSVSSAGHSFSVSQEAPERKLFSNKIKVVENKLRGHNPRLILESLLSESRHKVAPYFDNLKKAIWGKARNKEDILTGENLVKELIGLANDKNITGRSYIGLNLYV